MKNNLLEQYSIYQEKINHYDRQIWQIFAIGVALPLWILYKFWSNQLPQNLEISFILFGFIVFIYSFSLVLSNSKKKKRLSKICKAIEDKEKYIINGVIDDFFYIKTKHMAKIILLSTLLAYFITIWFKFQDYFYVFIIISLLFIILVLGEWCNKNKKDKVDNKIKENLKYSKSS